MLVSLSVGLQFKNKIPLLRNELFFIHLKQVVLYHSLISHFCYELGRNLLFLCELENINVSYVIELLYH